MPETAAHSIMPGANPNSLMGRIEAFERRTGASVSLPFHNEDAAWIVRWLPGGLPDEKHDNGFLMIAELDQRYPEPAQ